MTQAIAIDLGGMHASVAIVDERTILAVTHLPLSASEGLAALLPLLAATTHQLLASLSQKAEECVGVSLSLPSLVDFRSGRIVSTNDKYPDAVTTDLHGWCLAAFGLPLAIENDARAALIGEHSCGAAQGVSDVLMLTLGTGIGSAVLVGGQPFRTAQAQGGNLGGHVAVAINGRKCTCGAIGCMEAEASTWALPYIVREWPGVVASPLATATLINFDLLFQLAEAGDAIANDIAQHCIHIWAVGTVSLIHAYGPELVVFGGGVMKGGHLILPVITQYVHQHAWTPSGAVKILPATLGNNAALYAAVPLLHSMTERKSYAHKLR